MRTFCPPGETRTQAVPAGALTTDARRNRPLTVPHLDEARHVLALDQAAGLGSQGGGPAHPLEMRPTHAFSVERRSGAALLSRAPYLRRFAPGSHPVCTPHPRRINWSQVYEVTSLPTPLDGAVANRHPGEAFAPSVPSGPSQFRTSEGRQSVGTLHPFLLRFEELSPCPKT